MTGPETPDVADLTDDELLVVLGRVLDGHDATPRQVVESSKELFVWRTVDTELAALTSDSLLDGEPVGARGAGPEARAAAQPRIITFESDGLTIEVELDGGSGGRRLLGQVVPGQVAELELRTEGGSIRSAADNYGRFVIALPASRQQVSLRCVLADGSVVDGAWLTL